MLICQCNAIHRRDVVCGGGSALFSAIVATLIGSGTPVRAEAIAGKVPEIDRVAVRVVVDSYQFAVAPSRKVPMLRLSTSAGASAVASRQVKR